MSKDMEINFETQTIEDVASLKEETIISDPSSASLKYDKHGVLLDPQPSDDPRDPLNWSETKKNIILLVISLAALLPDYCSATGAVTLEAQAVEWNLPVNIVNRSQSANVFLLGAGGIVINIASNYFGRASVLFWWLVGALITIIWCTAATSFHQFMAARVLNGLFSTVSQSGGLMFIEDLFFFHQKPRKVNILSGFIIFSPYLGPCISAFIINTQKWQWAFGVCSILTGLALILTILFVDETFYDRKLSESEQPEKKSRFLRLLGVEQYKSRHLRNTFREAFMRPFIVLLKPTLFLTSFYYLLTFAWVVGINTTLAVFLTSVYKFGPKQIGFFYFTPIVATLIGEITGHWLHDAIANRYMSRHNGQFVPEVRLRAMFVAFPFTIAGLILLGFALEREYHYMIASLGWGLYVFSIMILTTGLNAYNLDCYPEASGEVNTWINFARTTGGFIVSYFMIEWVAKMGAIAVFSIMSGICAFAICIIIFVYNFGGRLRVWSGALHFHTY